MPTTQVPRLYVDQLKSVEIGLHRTAEQLEASASFLEDKDNALGHELGFYALTIRALERTVSETIESFEPVEPDLMAKEA